MWLSPVSHMGLVLTTNIFIIVRETLAHSPSTSPPYSNSSRAPLPAPSLLAGLIGLCGGSDRAQLF